MKTILHIINIKLSEYYFWRNKLAQAKYFARRAIMHNPDSPDGYSCFTDVCFFDGEDLAEAIEMLTKQQELLPNDHKIAINKAYLMSRLKK